MKRILACVLSLLMLSGCESPLKNANSPLEVAIEMKDTLNNNENSAIFMGKDINGDSLFENLEAIYPYAFSLELTYYPIGITEIKVDVSNNAMQKQAEILAKTIAQEQTKGLNTQEEKIAAIHDYLILNCKYDIDTAQSENLDGTTAPFTAYGALVDGKAVCSGYARAFMMMCNAVGIDAFYISSEQMNHSWNAVDIDGQIYYVDCTFDDPIPDQGQRIIRDYFLKTGEELKKTHTWNDNFYEQIID